MLNSPSPGHWALAPTCWAEPEEGLLSDETRGIILAAFEELPRAQRMVIRLREIVPAVVVLARVILFALGPLQRIVSAGLSI